MLNSGNREQDGNEGGPLLLQNFSYPNKHLDGFLTQEELPYLLLQIICTWEKFHTIHIFCKI